MAKIFEIAFNLVANAKSGFNNTFNQAEKNVNTLNQQISKMNRQKLDIEKYQLLKKSTSENTFTVASLANELTKMSSKVNQSAKAIDTQSKRVKEAQNALDQYRIEMSATDKVTEAQRQTQRKLSEVLQDEKKKLKDVTKEHKTLLTESNQLTKESKSAESALSKQTISLASLEKKLESAGIDTKDLSKHNNDLAESISKAVKQQEKMENIQAGKSKAKGEIAKNTKGLAAVGVMAAGAVGLPVKEAIQFESAMADVKKVVEMTDEEASDMGNAIRRLVSTEIPMAKEEFASIVAAGGQSGIEKSDLFEFASDAAKMGVAFNVEASEAGETMAQWRTAFQMNQEEVSTLADKVNYLGNTTAAAAPKIAEVVTRIGPLGDVGGVASGTIAALGASMIGVGIGEERAATGIKNLILNMTKGESATSSAKKAYEKLGFTSAEIAKSMQEDSEQTILSLLESIKMLPDDEQSSILTTLFGSESVAAIAPLLSNLNNLKDNLDKVTDANKYAGSMQSEFESRSATTENSLILMNNSIKSLVNDIGDLFLPMVNSGANAIGNIAGKAQEFIQKHPTLTKGIAITAAGVGGLVSALLVAGLVSNVAKLGFLTMQGALHGLKGATVMYTGAQKLLNLALIANPIGGFIVAAGTIIALLVLAYNKSESFRNTVDKMKEATLGLAKDGVEFLENKFASLCDFINSFKMPQWITDLSEKADTIAGKLPNIFSGGGKVGKNATGTNYWRGGMTWVGERGPELLNLPRGSQITPNNKVNKVSDIVSSWSGSGQGEVMKINFAPVYQLSVGNRAEIEKVNAEMLQQLQRLIEDILARYMRNQQRVSLGR